MSKTLQPLEVKINSLRPAIAELERAVQWAYSFTGDRFKELPDVTVTVQSKGKKAQCAAWFSKSRWSTKEGAPVHEINMSAEHLADDPIDVIGYIVHETCHLWNRDSDVDDVAKGGRHNKKFAQPAEDIFLLEPCGAEGKEWNATRPSDELRSRIEKEFQPDYAALSLFRTVDLKAKSRKSTRSWTCGGDTEECVKVQVPAKKNLNAFCEACSNSFFTEEEIPE